MIISEYYRAYGKCCSRGWFEHAEGIAAFLIGGTILDIQPGPFVPCSEFKGLTTKHYHFRITTDRGLAILDMRNEHEHGNYGSFIERLDTADTPIRITEDF